MYLLAADKEVTFSLLTLLEATFVVDVFFIFVTAKDYLTEVSIIVVNNVRLITLLSYLLSF